MKVTEKPIVRAGILTRDAMNDDDLFVTLYRLSQEIILLNRWTKLLTADIRTCLM